MTSDAGGRAKLLFFVTEDWYFVSHRLGLAVAARDAGFEVTVVTRVRECGDVIRNAGLKLVPFENARTGLNPLSELSTLIRLILLFRRERPDITHHVAMKPVLYGSIAARFARVPRMINALMGMGWVYSSGDGLARSLKFVISRALGYLLRSGFVLVQNPDDARLLMNIGVPNARIRCIAGSGVDLRQFAPHPEPAGAPVIVLPARLLWAKGIGEYVAAARLLKQRGVVARFLVAGAPDRENPSSVPLAQIAKWTDEGVFEFRGWVSDMAKLLSDSHIVCLPSYREGAPKSLIEAAAAGRPIVTSDVPGCREIVRDGVNGILVPPGNVEALAEALFRLIMDKQMRLRMGANGRERAEQEFGQETIIQQTLALYWDPMVHSTRSGTVRPRP